MRHAHNWCRPIQLALLCLPALTEWTSHPVDIHRCPGTGELLKIATSNWWCPRRCGGTPFPIWTVRQHLLVQHFFALSQTLTLIIFHFPKRHMSSRNPGHPAGCLQPYSRRLPGCVRVHGWQRRTCVIFLLRNISNAHNAHIPSCHI